MTQGSLRALISVTCLLLLGLAANAQEYERPLPQSGDGPPTGADLRLYGGRHKTLGVQILNLTPYAIELKSTSITDADVIDMQNRERETNKSFMVAPVGVPKFIPPADPSARPYGMTFSWVDDPEFMDDNWVKWTVKGVEYCTLWNELTHHCDGPIANRDVDVGLWMYRLEPPPSEVESGYLPMLSKFLLVVMKTGLIAIEPLNPIAWLDEFLALAELGATVQEFDESGATDEQNAAFGLDNSQWDEGTEVFVASYVIPHPQSFCATSGLGCGPSPMTETTGDGVYSIWPAGNAGPCSPNCPKLAAEAELTVSAHLLRGQSAPQCPEDPPKAPPHDCGVGRIPMLMLTVMKTDEFLAAKVSVPLTTAPVQGASVTPNQLDRMRLFLLQAGAGKIRAILRREGNAGVIELRSIITELNPDQRDVLRGMVGSMASRQNPTHEERELVRWISTSLQQRMH